MTEDQDLLDRLKQDDLTALDEVYISYKETFLLFGRTFSAPDEDITDIYQDTMISLYENVKNGKLETLTSSLKTYLFAIGRFKIYKQMERNKKICFEEQIIYSSEETRLFDISSVINK